MNSENFLIIAIFVLATRAGRYQTVARINRYNLARGPTS